MKRQLTENDFDRLLRKLLNDAAPDDATIEEIANSPGIWWGINRKINSKRKPLALRQAGLLWRWLIFGTPLTIAALVILALFMLKPLESVDQTIEIVSVSAPESPNDEVIASPASKSVEVISPDETSSELTRISKKFKRVATKTKSIGESKLRRKTSVVSDEYEIKSDFIALSYAENPESGQIIRVKVPRSMMVSLGLVASVDKPNSLISAEVILGDDGMTHAIRFIR